VRGGSKERLKETQRPEETENLARTGEGKKPGFVVLRGTKRKQVKNNHSAERHASATGKRGADNRPGKGEGKRSKEKKEKGRGQGPVRHRGGLPIKDTTKNHKRQEQGESNKE